MTQNKDNHLLLIILGLFIALTLSIMISSMGQRERDDERGVQLDQEVVEGMPIFNQANDGETFTLTKGDSFKVMLRENPTTGYCWTLDQAASEGIVLISQEYLPEQRDHDEVGRGGRRDMIFAAQQKGTATLVLHLSRPWEKGEEYRESFTLNFEVVD